MLIERQSCGSIIKSIAKVLWVIVCLVVIITTIVFLSTYLKSASNLRTPINVTNDFIILPRNFNASNYEKFLQYIKSNFSEVKEESVVNTTDILSRFPEYQETEKDNCPLEPPREDFTKCGSRVANWKCCEYIAAWKHKQNLMARAKCKAGFGIVGGSAAQLGDFPHMAAVGFKNKYTNEVRYKCGGSLISERFVLTAGHCTYSPPNIDPNFFPTPSIVGLGGTYIDKSENLKRFKIDYPIPHKSYKSPKVYFDVALLKLKDKVMFTHTIHPACLSTELWLTDTAVNITGWGITNTSGPQIMSNTLQVASVKLVNRTDCTDYVNSNRNFKKLRIHQICAGVVTGKVDTCKGDSGGPAQVRINTPYGNIHRLVGVTSFGHYCAVEGKLGVYTSVSHVLSWIEKVVWNDYKSDHYEGILND